MGSMNDLVIPSDAFSHGQIRSKIWLSENFAVWSKKHLSPAKSFELHWYGSWVGIGPLLMLSRNELKFHKLNLFDLNPENLATSLKVLDFWRCESVEITTQTIDVNEHRPQPGPHQIFVNSACEHMAGSSWLKNIPEGAFVLLQSTDMKHHEHINCAENAVDFINKYSPWLTVLESSQIDFNYPDKRFSRFMLFGTKK